MSVTHIEAAGDGWLIEWNTHRSIHLNSGWLEAMLRHRVKGNNPAFNWLEYQFHNSDDADTISEAFTAFYRGDTTVTTPTPAGRSDELRDFMQSRRAQREDSNQ